jgi:hypothetical protein
MSLTHMDFFGNGDFIRLSIPFGSVTPNTVVTGSITEIDGDGLPFLGDAALELHNVAPRDHFVDVVAAVLWDNPLNYRINLAIFD